MPARDFSCGGNWHFLPTFQRFKEVVRFMVHGVCKLWRFGRAGLQDMDVSKNKGTPKWIL